MESLRLKQTVMVLTLVSILLLIAILYFSNFSREKRDFNEALKIVEAKAGSVYPGKRISKPREIDAFEINKEGVNPLSRLEILRASNESFATDEEKELQALIQEEKALLFEFYVFGEDSSPHFALLRKKDGEWSLIAFTKKAPKKQIPSKPTMKSASTTTLVDIVPEPSSPKPEPKTPLSTVPKTTVTVPSTTSTSPSSGSDPTNTTLKDEGIVENIR